VIDASALAGPLRLHCGVQHYAWGDRRYIPSLLSIEEPAARPHAELWMGAHPELPGAVELGGRRVALDALIAHAPEAILGPRVVRELGPRLPYLFKVLSAAQPLSIQAHPSKRAAEEGFAREHAAGIPLSAGHRNYRDDNHKPELLAALTDFWGLRGFRPFARIARTLAETPELRDAGAAFEPSPAGLERLYRTLMAWPQERVDATLGPLLERLRENDARDGYGSDDAEYWILRSDELYSRDGHHDRGLFALLLLNLVHLRPGEAIYLPAGVLHAYLEGSGVELMANSNNVLRGGLTPKHVDLEELARNVTFEGGDPRILRPERLSDTESRYPTPAREFELRRIDLEGGRTHITPADHGPEILLAIEAPASGGVELAAGGHTLALPRGGVAFMVHGVRYSAAATGRAALFKATVPS